MQKITIPLIVFVAVVHLHAQDPVVLKFEDHAIKSESNNSMKLCKYVDPDEGGVNRIWDFSGIETTSEFTGFVRSSYHSVNSGIFPRADTELNEFNNRFYFRTEDNRIEQVGYSSQDNLVVTEFDKPFVKMIYPFTMGDHFEGTFNGTYKIGELTNDIRGSYEVIADGAGRLILPDNYTVDNTLRVRTLKNYSYELKGFSHLFEIVTYKWYCEWHRYPLLVLTQIKSTVDDHTSVSYQAAFNNELSKPAGISDREIQADRLFEIYPNPTGKFLNITYTVENEGRVWFGLYDLSGKEFKVIYDEEMAAGIYYLELNLLDEGLTEGTYFLKSEIDSKTQTEKFMLVL